MDKDPRFLDGAPSLVIPSKKCRRPLALGAACRREDCKEQCAQPAT